ncbi:unnamed protein product, partial [Polarella glacialis]
SRASRPAGHREAFARAALRHWQSSALAARVPAPAPKKQQDVLGTASALVKMQRLEAAPATVLLVLRAWASVVHEIICTARSAELDRLIEHRTAMRRRAVQLLASTAVPTGSEAFGSCRSPFL